MSVKTLCALFCSAALAGCTSIVTQTPVDAELPGNAWNAPIPTTVKAIDAGWWQQWNDAQLAQLLQRAQENNTDVRTALANLRNAAALSDVATADLFPTLAASAGGSRNWNAGRAANSFNGQGSGAWSFSLAGGNIAAKRAADYDAMASALTLADTRALVASEVAQTYINLRLAVVQKSIREETLANYEEAAKIAHWRHEAGLIDQTELDSAIRDREGARAAIPAADKAIAQYRNALARLTVQNASHIAIPQQSTVPTAPSTLAVEIPAQVLERRPDLRAARMNVLAAAQRVRQAQANWFPSLDISGSFGTSAATIGALGASGTGIASLLASISMPVLNWSQTAGAEEQSQASLDSARAAYTSTLVSALEETENALSGIASAEQRKTPLEVSERSARSAASLAMEQYRAGLVDYLTVLSTQRTLLTAREELESNRADLATQMVDLYRALGGGWDLPRNNNNTNDGV